MLLDGNILIGLTLEPMLNQQLMVLQFGVQQVLAVWTNLIFLHLIPNKFTSELQHIRIVNMLVARCRLRHLNNTLKPLLLMIQSGPLLIMAWCGKDLLQFQREQVSLLVLKWTCWLHHLKIIGRLLFGQVLVKLTYLTLMEFYQKRGLYKLHL